MTWLRVRVELLETSPTIWRELLIPADLPLPQVSLVLQVAMGWANSHLHSFARTSETHWQSRPRWVMDVPGEPIEDEESELPEAGATLATLLQAPGDQATYLYDFGDDWEHLLTAVEILDGDSPAVVDLTAPVLTEGEGACPPEDVGGVRGHEELLEHVAALERGEVLDEWPEHVVLWAFGTLDPEPIRAALTFDLAEQQARVAAVGRPLPPMHPDLAGMLAAVPATGLGSLHEMVQATDLAADAHLSAEDAVLLTENIRWFLDLVGDEGLALTAAGYLRPAVVEQVARRLHLDREWIGSFNREDQTPGVAQFRALLVRLGLLRKAKGRLSLTKAGASMRDDPMRLLAHIAGRLPLPPGDRHEFEHQASLLAMLSVLSAHGDRSSGLERCADILTELGWRAGDDAVPRWGILHAIPDTLTLLARSGFLVEDEGPGYAWDGPRWEATPHGAAFLRRFLRGEPIFD